MQTIRTGENEEEKKRTQNIMAFYNSVNDQMERIHVKEVSPAEFIRRYEAPYKPVVILGVQDDWNASYKWTLQVQPQMACFLVT